MGIKMTTKAIVLAHLQQTIDNYERLIKNHTEGGSYAVVDCLTKIRNDLIKKRDYVENKP